MDNSQIIRRSFEQSIAAKRALLSDPDAMAMIEQVADLIIACYGKRRKVLFCGNGGSAADAQHLAAELSGRYYYDRPPLAAEALHVNTSYLTAVANDYSYDEVYARLIRGIGIPGDILIGMSTSGNSENVIRAFHAAQELDMKTVALTGESGGKMRDLCDIVLRVPSSDTPRIQESHMLIGHSICQIVEHVLFPKPA